MTTQHPAPSSADIDAARLLLARLGVSPADLLAAAEERAPAPTFAEYIPAVRTAVTKGTRLVLACLDDEMLLRSIDSGEKISLDPCGPYRFRRFGFFGDE